MTLRLVPLYVFQAFCEFQMTAGQPPVRRKNPFDETLSGSDGPDLAARFLTWYILEGHPGLKVRKSSGVCWA